MIQKAFKYRLYPNPEQKVLLSKHFGCSRYIYNWALNLKNDTYKKEQKSLSYEDIANNLPDLKSELNWLTEVNSQTLQASLKNLDKAFTNFFRHIADKPNFKSKHSNKQSFQCPQFSRVDFESQKLYIPKFMKEGIKCKFHRTFIGKIKTVTITKTCTDKYFTSILVEIDENIPEKPEIAENSAIGLDLGIKTFAVSSDGSTFSNPKFLKKSLKRLKHLQRNLSRTKKRSKNRTKARLRLALQYEKVTNQRSDFLHKLTNKLTHDNQVDTICLETLKVDNMLKNHKLAQAISDCSWSKFVELLTYKADWHGKNILRIDTFTPSSKICSCGELNHSLTLKDRVWTCEVCGVTHDRDFLAANNIKYFAFLKLSKNIGQELPEFKSVECSLEHYETESYGL
jgi:putative transposase